MGSVFVNGHGLKDKNHFDTGSTGNLKRENARRTESMEKKITGEQKKDRGKKVEESKGWKGEEVAK